MIPLFKSNPKECCSTLDVLTNLYQLYQHGKEVMRMYKSESREGVHRLME